MTTAIANIQELEKFLKENDVDKLLKMCNTKYKSISELSTDIIKLSKMDGSKLFIINKMFDKIFQNVSKEIIVILESENLSSLKEKLKSASDIFFTLAEFILSSPVDLEIMYKWRDRIDYICRAFTDDMYIASFLNMIKSRCIFEIKISRIM